MIRNFTHITIPAEIWLRRDISIQAKALWAEMRSLHDKEEGGCFASDDYLIEFMGLKRSRLHELYKELKDCGLMEVVSFNGRRTIRRAIVPEVDYGGQQLSGIPDTCYPGFRTPAIRDSGLPPYIEKKEENKANTHHTSQSEEAADAAGVCGLTPRQIGTNPKALGTNPRAKGTNPRAIGTNPRAKTGERIAFGDYVFMTQAEFDGLCHQHGAKVIQSLVDEMNDYCAARGVKYKDYAAAIRQWIRRRDNQPSGGGRGYGPPKVDRRTKNVDGTPVDAPHLKDLF